MKKPTFTFIQEIINFQKKLGGSYEDTWQIESDNLSFGYLMYGSTYWLKRGLKDRITIYAYNKETGKIIERSRRMIYLNSNEEAFVRLEGKRAYFDRDGKLIIKNKMGR